MRADGCDQLLVDKYKPNALKFWVEDGFIPLCVDSCLILVCLPVFLLQIFQETVTLNFKNHLSLHEITLFEKTKKINKKN